MKKFLVCTLKSLGFRYFHASYWPKSRSTLTLIYSENVTKFCEISTLDLSYVVTVNSLVEISQNFVAFSEYMNFKQNHAGMCWILNIEYLSLFSACKNNGKTQIDIQNSTCQNRWAALKQLLKSIIINLPRIDILQSKILGVSTIFCQVLLTSLNLESSAFESFLMMASPRWGNLNNISSVLLLNMVEW